jgi:hopene-associated glycosyltransferase HpnB
MDAVWLALPGLCIWATICVLPWRPWSTRETLDAGDDTAVQDLSEVTVLMPARNEARHIITTLTAVADQGRNHRIILIDDESSDATADLAASLRLPNLIIIRGEPLPRGWSGKLWALEQGRRAAHTRYLLLLDADIRLQPGLVPALLAKLNNDTLQLASLMAFLRMESRWEKMLMPAFIYFFKLLYPFRLSNSASQRVAAAAGGCILMERRILDQMGGFAVVKNELIDDCALARRVKNLGGRTWIGLTRSAQSLRCYENLASVWRMVARTAFTQLHHSPALLLVCTLLMTAAFVLPLVCVFSGPVIGVTVSLTALLLMIMTYFPTLHYYGVNPVWACTLPVTGILYLLMTWGSAISYWRGAGASWKGRTYA